MDEVLLKLELTPQVGGRNVLKAGVHGWCGKLSIRTPMRELFGL